MGLRLAVVPAIALALPALAPGGAVTGGAASTGHARINCMTSPLCTEVQDSEAVFGEGNYVGHDEPSVLFYSGTPGSATRQRYQLVLPSDPSPSNPLTPGKSYNFQLHPAFWFGLAMCDVQSFPEQIRTCAPGTDANISDPAITPRHVGEAFMEMQFYPPGWAPFQLPGGISCDPHKWCAALNIDSLSENPVTGQTLNPTCAARTGVEYVNFAFITRNGVPQAPPNPVDSTAATFTPNPSRDLFMNSGDRITVTMQDTSHGLRIDLADATSGQSGFMVASAANNFGMVKWAPTGTTCQNIPYDFHPMYSTSSEKTRVTWAAHTYNVSFSDEIGHFDFCSTVTSSGTCHGTEGVGAQREPSDGDDLGCLPASVATLVKINGCANGAAVNQGFDGPSYLPVWPDGNTRMHPTPIQFSSPLTGASFTENFSRMGFETDLPRIEVGAAVVNCNRDTGTGCTLIPPTDDGNPAAFYPFYDTTQTPGGCMWQEGSHIPGDTNEFGQNAQYGTLLNVTYTGPGGGAISHFNDFRQVLSHNPCPA